MFVVIYRKIFYALTALIVAASLFSIFFFGLTFGIDFTGGSILEVSYPDGRPAKSALETQLKTLPIGVFSLRETGDTGYILRTQELSESSFSDVFSAMSLGDAVTVNQERFSSIGPVVGEELRGKAMVAVVIVVLVIVTYVAFVFRKVSKPISSWKYGAIVIFVLIHDIVVPVGVFALLGHLTGSEIDVLFVTGLLAILGYSINDTIVVFDRVRENLRINHDMRKKEDFLLTVGKSLNQAFTRSINTSLTTVLAVLALFFLGPVATRDFAILLITGIVAGTYSSIALATPLLVTLERWGKKV